VDEQMAHEVQGQIQGAGAGRVDEEWREPEPAGEDQRDPALAPEWRAYGDDDGTLRDPDEREARARLGRYVPRSVFPAKRDELMAAARAHRAPDEIVAELRGLDGERRYETVASVWTALGYPSDERF